MAIREIVEVSTISEKMGQIFGELFGYLGRKGIQPRGPPFAFYHSWSEQTTDMELGVPVEGINEGEGRVKSGALPGGRVIRAMHIGPYDKLVDTYTEMEAWAKENGYELAGFAWENYLTDPQKESDTSKWMTEVFWPIK